MQQLSDYTTELSNNVTEQHVFQLFYLFGLETWIDHLDEMFNGFIYQGERNGELYGDVYLGVCQLKIALTAASKEFERKRDLLRESEQKTEKTTEKEGL